MGGFATLIPKPRRAALLYCDLDRFKQINDSQGQRTGDAVLRAFRERCAATQ